MDKATRNKVLRKIPYGLFVIGVKNPHGVLAIVANWVTQVSFEPPLVVISIEHESEMRHRISESKFFSLNMFPSGSVHHAKAFLKKAKDHETTVNGKEFTSTIHGVPFFHDAVASLECKVVQSLKTGDHEVFIGEVIDGVLTSDEEMLTLKETGWKYSR